MDSNKRTFLIFVLRNELKIRLFVEDIESCVTIFEQVFENHYKEIIID